MIPEANQSMPMTPAPAEPREEPNVVPVWLLVCLALLLYWGMVYFDQRGGWFNEHVYIPYGSFQELAAWQPSNPEESFLLMGKKLFHDNCAVCHMDTGAGNPANGCPPLVGSEWVAAPGPDRLIRFVSKGLTGPIEVGGKVYNTGTMLAMGDQLPGDEKEKCEKIAAIISYIRTEFGKKPGLIKPEHVAAVRTKIVSHTANFTPDELKTVPENE
jgi:mono/diheme cytochrome c family protein